MKTQYPAIYRYIKLYGAYKESDGLTCKRKAKKISFIFDQMQKCYTTHTSSKENIKNTRFILDYNTLCGSVIIINILNSITKALNKEM